MNKSVEKLSRGLFYNRSLERALGILNAFSVERPFLTLSQLSELLTLPRATVLRLCSTLVKFGFLRHDGLSKTYSLGLRILELGACVSQSFAVRKIASLYMDRLAMKLSKTTFLGILDNDELLYIDKRDDPRNPIAFTSQVGTRRPAYWGMIGSVLMAFLPDDEVRRILKKTPLAPLTKRSITRTEDFLKWLKEIRTQGFALEVETALEGITGVAAPIFDHRGGVVAGIGVGFISSSVDQKELERIIKEVTATAQAISGELGYRGEKRL